LRDIPFLLISQRHLLRNLPNGASAEAMSISFKTAIFVAAAMLAFFQSGSVALARAPTIPHAYQGAWSTSLEFCGNDSDGNYFIQPSTLDAWEVSWHIVQLSTGSKNVLIIQAIHEEYENTFPVRLTINRLDPDSIQFEECTFKPTKHCWRVKLLRCPD
jgi:hypothetical protein